MEPLYPSNERFEFLTELNVADAFHQALDERCKAAASTIERLQYEHEEVLKTSASQKLGTLIHKIKTEVDSCNTDRGILEIFAKKIRHYIMNKELSGITITDVVVQIIPGMVGYVPIDRGVDGERIRREDKQHDMMKTAISNPGGVVAVQEIIGVVDNSRQFADILGTSANQKIGGTNNAVLIPSDDPNVATVTVKFDSGTSGEMAMRIKAKEVGAKYRTTIYFRQDDTSPKGYVQVKYDEKKKELHIEGQMDNADHSLNATFGQIDAALQAEEAPFYVEVINANGTKVSSMKVKSGLIKPPLAEGLTAVDNNSSSIKTVVKSLD